MDADYKLKLGDLSPYFGISNYVSRNEFNKGTLIPKESRARWRLKMLEFYNMAFGVGTSVLFLDNEQSVKNGLEYLLIKILLRN